MGLCRYVKVAVGMLKSRLEVIFSIGGIDKRAKSSRFILNSNRLYSTKVTLIFKFPTF